MPAQESKPNILVFFTDDQRFDTINALGNSRIHTPNIDRLVRRDTTFTQAHIPCGTHGAICMPSRAMLHTGRTLFHLLNSGETIPDEHTMLGEHLQQQGYKTWGAGKWHNGPASFNRSFQDGDEIMFGGMADHWNVPAYHYDATGKYDKQLPEIRSVQTNNKIHWRNADHIHAGKHSSEILCERGAEFIREQSADQPFFAYIALLAPHDPRTMPKQFLDMYPVDDVELPPNCYGGHPFDNGALRIRDELLAEFPRTPEDMRQHNAEYYGMISHLDNELGKVLDALDDQGLTDNTIIVFAGDNGLAVGQHGLMGKQNCYEHSVHVPLIFAGPGIPEDNKSDAFVYLLDTYRTLCNLLGIDVPESVEGESLVDAMHNPDVVVRESLYFAYVSSMRAVKNSTHKLIEYAPRGDRNTQLFNHEDDPWELHNLVGEAGSDEIVDAMRQDMFRYRDDWESGHTERSARFWERYH